MGRAASPARISLKIPSAATTFCTRARIDHSWHVSLLDADHKDEAQRVQHQEKVDCEVLEISRRIDDFVRPVWPFRPLNGVASWPAGPQQKSKPRNARREILDVASAEIPRIFPLCAN
jgi:hypothetical protein